MYQLVKKVSIGFLSHIRICVSGGLSYSRKQGRNASLVRALNRLSDGMNLESPGKI